MKTHSVQGEARHLGSCYVHGGKDISRAPCPTAAAVLASSATTTNTMQIVARFIVQTRHSRLVYVSDGMMFAVVAAAPAALGREQLTQASRLSMTKGRAVRPA